MSTFWRQVAALDLEEKILNGGALLAALSVFFPWFGGKMLGTQDLTYSGFGFYTSLIGLSVFVLHAGILLTTIVPLLGGPRLLKKASLNTVRLAVSLHATVLVIAALSVLTRVTFEFSQMEVRFGLYTALISSLVVNLYAFLRIQQEAKSHVEELFYKKTEEHVHTMQEEPIQTPQPSKPEQYHYHRTR